MFSLPLRCCRAPPRAALFRSFIHHHPNNSSLNSSPLLSKALYTNANVKRKLFHTTSHARYPELKPNPIVKQAQNASRLNASNVEHVEAEDVPVGKPPGASRQVLFFVVGGIALYIYTAGATNFITEEMIQKLRGSIYSVNNLNISRLFEQERMIYARKYFDALVGQMFFLSKSIKDSLIATYRGFAEKGSADRLMWMIVLANGLVFTLWKFPSMRAWMGKHFVHSAVSGKSYTLLTSMFSHESFLHIAFNMVALHSFGMAAYSFLSQAHSKLKPHMYEATADLHFIAFFITAGVFASLVSHFVKAKFQIPAAIRFFKASSYRPVSAKTLRAIFPPSLGASGAIYSCVTLTALAYPDTSIALLFIPIPINIQTGVAGLVMLDIMGILNGWKSFDHFAHLGGALFGVLYYYYGPTFWYVFRMFTGGGESADGEKKWSIEG